MDVIAKYVERLMADERPSDRTGRTMTMSEGTEAIAGTSPFASIPEAVEDIRAGRIVIVVDDADRENEGDLIMAAEKVTPEAIAFMVRHRAA